MPRRIGAKYLKSLALDVGAARVGVAVSDAEGVLAFPHSTIHVYAFEQVADEVADIVAQEAVQKIFVGLPISDDGEESRYAAEVRRFVSILRDALSSDFEQNTDPNSPGVPEIVFVDERYTTKMAHNQLHELGLQPSKSRSIVDQLAAVNILSDALTKSQG
ncbi:MAG: Holliday junction resolvase RuvX [Candidatus Ancillula sp.]|jgi:putative Holliday junction resolvase|nr:Holliday junction resolvase RuvX [Candidatus Ancillula sp.]